MIKIQEAIIQEGPMFKKGYEAVMTGGATPKDVVRYHIDNEVGDVYDLIADLSKMVWILNRKIEGTSTEDDKLEEEKLTARMTSVTDILHTYYK